MNLLLSLGDSGIELSDIGLRIFAGEGEELPVGSLNPAVSLSEVEGLTVDYVLANLPQLPGIDYTITYEYPAGVYFSDSWSIGFLKFRPPTFLIIGLRIAGLSISDLDFKLFRDTEDVTADFLSDLELIDLTSDTFDGDYLISGWPAPALGEVWRLRWEISGVYYYREWTGTQAVIGQQENRYIRIWATSEPIPFNTDSYNRQMWSINFNLKSTGPNNKIILDVATILTNAGLGDLNSNMKVGPLAVIPAGDGPFIHLLNTGGSEAEFTHDSDKTQNSSLQIVVYAKSYSVGDNRSMAIYQLLDGIHELTI